MSDQTTTPRTTIEADPDLPKVTITRDFDAPVEALFRAWTERDLVARWLGPDETEMRIETWDCRTGGSYRYTAVREGEEIAKFFGSFHDVTPTRLVQTFTWEGMPEAVSLETLTFGDLGGGRTRCVSVALVESMEAREAMLASGMEVGIEQGYAKLDRLLAAGL